MKPATSSSLTNLRWRADVDPSGAGGDKESLMASSSTELVAERMVSKGEPDIPATEAFRTDEVLP